jgi:hypothetical protein
VTSYFKFEIENFITPGKLRCEQFLAENRNIHHPWRVIKNCIWTKIKKFQK